MIASRAEFWGDQSKKCRRLAFGLHEWVADAAGVKLTARSAVEPVVVTCTGIGSLNLSHSDLNTTETVSLVVDIVSTRKCRDFFESFLEALLKLK